MLYRLLADLVVALHVAYVSFVVLGLLLILIGVFCKWSWVRNPWFRVAHLAAIGIVALEAVFGIACPLTEWEDQLRIKAGLEVHGESFVGRLLHDLIFVSWPPWVLNVLHVGFGLLVLATFLLAPPRWRGRAPVSGS